MCQYQTYAHLDFSLPLDWVPDALSDLQMRQIGAIHTSLASFAQVHVRYYTR